MYKLITYLKHVITATNQHGVHSPFVYDYLTKCLYVKSDIRGVKSRKTLLKTIPYFSVKKLKIISENPQIGKRIQKEFDIKESEESPFDLIYLDGPKADILSICQDEIHNESLIFIENIHRTKNATASWETLKQNHITKVSIDMYYCGLLFFRKEQVKEHFKIRI